MADTQLNISYHSITDKGGRAVNEDSLGILPTKDALYFLLCDGLGGHGSGDIASSFVVEQMKANLEKGISVEKSITQTQQALLEKQKKEDATDKMKTTLTCLTISNLDASFAHVGDSRIYYFEKGKRHSASCGQKPPFAGNGNRMVLSQISDYKRNAYFPKQYIFTLQRWILGADR